MASELTAEQLAELERLIDRATEGPWMVFLSRESGSTQMHVMQHTHTGVALDRAYWANEDRPEGDENGYLQPDALCDVPENRLAVALLIGKLREYAPALIAAAKRLVHRDQQWMDGINEACGTTIRFDPLDWETRHLKPLDTFVHDLRARATAAEARVGELTEALEKVSGVLEDERWDGSREDGPRAMLDWCMTIARTALKPQEPHP